MILVGDSNVGKTHLISRYVKGELPREGRNTIGVEFHTKGIKLKAGGTVKAQIWDTAGAERFRAITSAHYRKAVGAVVVYDITDPRSFSAVRKWVQDVRDLAEPNIVIMLVGNKLDIVESDPSKRQVSTESGQDFASENSLLFMETSAVADVNVRDVFEELT